MIARRYWSRPSSTGGDGDAAKLLGTVGVGEPAAGSTWVSEGVDMVAKMVVVKRAQATDQNAPRCHRDDLNGDGGCPDRRRRRCQPSPTSWWTADGLGGGPSMSPPSAPSRPTSSCSGSLYDPGPAPRARPRRWCGAADQVVTHTIGSGRWIRPQPDAGAMGGPPGLVGEQRASHRRAGVLPRECHALERCRRPLARSAIAVLVVGIFRSSRRPSADERLLADRGARPRRR